jgi:hypothetical protein
MDDKRFITETKMFDGRLAHCEILTNDRGNNSLCFNFLSPHPSQVILGIGSPEELASWCDDIKAIALERAKYDKIMAEQAKQKQMAEEEREQLRNRLKQIQKEKVQKMKQIRIQQQEVNEPTLF